MPMISINAHSLLIFVFLYFSNLVFGKEAPNVETIVSIVTRYEGNKVASRYLRTETLKIY